MISYVIITHKSDNYIWVEFDDLHDRKWKNINFFKDYDEEDFYREPTQTYS